MSALFKRSAKVILTVFFMICLCSMFIITVQAEIIFHAPEEGARIPLYGNRNTMETVNIEAGQEFHKTIVNGEEKTLPYYLCARITFNGEQKYYVRFAYASNYIIDFDLPITDIGTYQVECLNDYPIVETNPTGDVVHYSYNNVDDFTKVMPEKILTFTSYHAEHIEESTYTVDVEPTCAEKGSRSKHCTRCNAIIEGTVEEIPATGEHKWDDWTITTSATCTTNGEKKHKCNVCDAEESEIIPATGHTVVTDTAVPATTTFTGLTEGSHCSVCGTVLAAQQTIPMIVKESSTEQAEQNTISDSGEKDEVESTFYPLCARQKKVKKNSITFTWNRVKGASSYVVYGFLCGTHKSQKLTTTTATSYTWKKLKKGTYYKIYVVAKNGADVTSISKKVHVATSGKSYGNATSVTVKKKSIKLKKGKTFKIGASVKKKGKVKQHRRLSYESTNPAVAKVTSSGTIKAVGKGTCYVYAYTQNGLFKRVKVTVKK